MRIATWNVNGYRAVLKKGFTEAFESIDADVFCLQETKLQQGQHQALPKEYKEYWHYALRKGYSGTASFTKTVPLSFSYGLGREEHDGEGRVITLEYEDFYLVNCYTPNSRDGLVRLDYRMDWEEALREYLVGLRDKKHVILCGDLNVAHQEIDLKHPKTNRMNPGFTDSERDCFGRLLAAGFTDVFRCLYPAVTDAYTWWSYRAGARDKNVGWRIDYFVVSDGLMPSVRDCRLLTDIYGSDHCPVLLELG